MNNLKLEKQLKRAVRASEAAAQIHVEKLEAHGKKIAANKLVKTTREAYNKLTSMSDKAEAAAAREWEVYMKLKTGKGTV